MDKLLRGSDCKYRESAAGQAQKIENPDNLPEEHLWGAIFALSLNCPDFLFYIIMEVGPNVITVFISIRY